MIDLLPSWYPYFIAAALGIVIFIILILELNTKRTTGSFDLWSPSSWLAPRRTKYQTAGKTGMRKFAVKPGVYYAWSPVERSNSRTEAEKWVSEDKADRGEQARHRIVETSNREVRKGQKKFTVYRTYYP